MPYLGIFKLKFEKAIVINELLIIVVNFGTCFVFFNNLGFTFLKIWVRVLAGSAFKKCLLPYKNKMLIKGKRSNNTRILTKMLKRKEKVV